MNGINQIENVAVEVNNISKTFKNIKALDGVSLTIRKNEIFGLLGPNGSGKTTLLRILATLLPPDPPGHHDSDRKCKIMGYDLFKEQDKIRRIIGYAPQQDPLYGDLSAIDNLKVFSAPYDMDKKRQNEHIEELLKMVNLYDRRNDLVKTFSGGMAKRLSFVCSLIHDPSLLLFDEVTVGIDVKLYYEIWNFIRELKNERTVIFTTHYIPDAEANCDRVAIMSRGRVLDCGAPRELMERHPPAANLAEVMLLLDKGS